MDVDRGELVIGEGTGLQGHPAQFLAVLSLAGVPSNYPLYAGRSRFDVAKLVRNEAADCDEANELTFTLIGLAHYLDTDTSWVGADGQPWDFPRLLAAEMAQPIVGTTCGGTHRLMALAHSLRKRRREGRAIEGQWRRAEMFLEDFVDYTFKMQNRDGSFSTDWYDSREAKGDIDRQIQTSGHMTEFLLTTLPDDELDDPRLISAIRFIAGSMARDAGRDWSIGPKGHALRSLAMYYERVYGVGSPIMVQSAGRAGSRR